MGSRFSWMIVLVMAMHAGVGAADVPLHSAARLPGETYEQAMQRYGERLKAAHVVYSYTTDIGAQAEAKSIAAQTYRLTTDYPDYDTVLRAFRAVRDARWLPNSGAGFLRRESWLYPDDGCFARAALAVANLKAWGYQVPEKIFVFGNLRVKTKNHPSGEVLWSYHVAPIVRMKKGTAEQKFYILDPAIEPNRPLTESEWLARMTDSPMSVKMSVCGPFTYGPASLCHTSPEAEAGSAYGDQLPFLFKEVDRLATMGRILNNELGNLPPWN